MDDTSKTGTPAWYFDKLIKSLNSKQERLKGLSDYLDGNAPLPEGGEKMRKAYRDFQQKSRTNHAEIVVEAVQERMTPDGFTVGDATELDKEASLIWSVNEMDIQAADVHSDMLGLSEGFCIVGPAGDDGIPVITRENPKQIAVMRDPLRPSKITAALKLYTDEVLGKDIAHLYLPGYDYVASRKARNDTPSTYGQGYEWDFDLWVNDGRLPVQLMPVVGFPNRRGLGEFETHTDILDRINYMVLQRLVIVAVQAYRQRAITGAPLTDEAGEFINYDEIFRPGPGAVWNLDEGQSIWESTPTDIRQILEGAKDDIRDLAAVTRTPMYMLMPDSQNQSAEGAQSAREALVFKTLERIKYATYGWNTVMQLAFAYQGRGIQNVETKWLAPERYSLAERMDAATKAQAAGLPFGTILRSVMQFPPIEAERIETERLNDILVGAIAQPVTGEADVV